MSVDWPLAITLVVVFVVMSYARWRWFRARMRRNTPPSGDNPS